MSAAREEILRRIGEALRDVPESEKAIDVQMPRDYRQKSELARRETVDLFAQRVAEYQASVLRVDAADLAGTIGATLLRRGIRRLVIPAGLPAEWVPKEVELRPDDELTAEELDACDGVLTGCALGIAPTGTIALDGGPGQGRRVISLVPDYCLCIVREDQIVGLVPEGIERLRTAATAGQPITLISGPSATSDVELTRVEGVHGPRTLEVLIVSNA